MLSTLALTANGQPLAATCQPSGQRRDVRDLKRAARGDFILLAATVSDLAGNVSPAATVSFSTDIATRPSRHHPCSRRLPTARWRRRR